MSDPLVSTDTAIEGAKAVGSGGGLLAIGVMLFQKYFKKAERDDEREAKALESVAAELKTINAGIASLSGKIDVLTERTSTIRADMDKAEVEIKSMTERLAKLEGKFDHLSEQLAK